MLPGKTRATTRDNTYRGDASNNRRFVVLDADVPARLMFDGRTDASPVIHRDVVQRGKERT